MNIIGNAIKFTHHGEIKISGRLLRTAEKKMLCVDVKDTGTGINSNDQQKLFKSYQQCNSEIYANFGGTGLGLSLSKQLANLLGGDVILLESQDGKGSTFRIVLPAEFSKVNTANLQTIASGVADPNGELNVLLVEDTKDNQALVGLFLKNSSYHLYCAENGKDGLQKALSGNYDIVLMDLQMPEIDGFEATKRLRRAGYEKPIIALSADHDVKDKVIKNGFSEYLTKPFDKTTLLSTLKFFAH